jgi:hypothetical protein
MCSIKIRGGLSYKEINEEKISDTFFVFYIVVYSKS